VQYKNIFAMIFNEIKCHVNTSLGLLGGMHPSPLFAPGQVLRVSHITRVVSLLPTHQKFLNHIL